MPKVKRGASLTRTFQALGMVQVGMGRSALAMTEIEAYGRAIGGLTAGERRAIRAMSDAYLEGLAMTHPLANPGVDDD